MSIYLVRVFFLFLVFVGVGLLILTYKMGKKLFGSKPIAVLHLNQKESVFELSKSGNYAIWLAGPQLTKNPVLDIKPQIVNMDNGQTLQLSTSMMRSHVSNGTTARVKVYSFYAEAGANYKIHFIDESYISGLERTITEPVASMFPTGKVEDFSFQVRNGSESKGIVVFVLSLLLGIFSIIGGLIMTALVDKDMF